ncbi:MAG: hypothetical protein ACK5RX_12060, partial [bacterium]
LHSTTNATIPEDSTHPAPSKLDGTSATPATLVKSTTPTAPRHEATKAAPNRTTGGWTLPAG